MSLSISLAERKRGDEVETDMMRKMCKVAWEGLEKKRIAIPACVKVYGRRMRAGEREGQTAATKTGVQCSAEQAE